MEVSSGDEGCQEKNNLFALGLTLTEGYVYPQLVICFARNGRCHHDGHRQGPERVRRDRFKGLTQSGKDQRRHPQARAATRETAELPDELGGAQPGHSPHFYHRSVAARIHPSFFSEIARAVAQTVRPHGYHMIISGFEEDPELEVSEAESFLARQVDGLIIASAQPARHLDLFKRIQKRDVPYILIDRPIRGLKASFVGVENREIGRIATEHLIAKGCRRIGHLRGPKMGIADERYEGCQRALQEAGLSLPTRYVVSGGHGDDAGYEGMSSYCACVHASMECFVSATRSRLAP